MFSNLRATPMENTNAPLRAWAIKNSPFAACWKVELEKAGIAAERLSFPT